MTGLRDVALRQLEDAQAQMTRAQHCAALAEWLQRSAEQQRDGALAEARTAKRLAALGGIGTVLGGILAVVAHDE